MLISDRFQGPTTPISHGIGNQNDENNADTLANTTANLPLTVDPLLAAGPFFELSILLCGSFVWDWLWISGSPFQEIRHNHCLVDILVNHLISVSKFGGIIL